MVGIELDGGDRAGWWGYLELDGGDRVGSWG